ncbi:MAG: type I glyceraldehyde-3-phosphate dehydrogenase [Planctomycetes bacterium]|nr:type I glyceraldehyde-3-phosphate dehydrogenase [Planctomycetota bacterium]NOG55129.1 type I glyceraldehyde-3-phosphate dehydrogenase [Planctomycetota bacterium]
MAIRIGINGFGRIGRLVVRNAIRQGGFDLVGINDLVPADNLAYLLKYDSVHGRFDADIEAGEDWFTVNGDKVVCSAERDQANLKWDELGADYVIESTGLFTKYEDAIKHQKGSVKRVLISAPTKSGPDQVRTFCYKVNHEDFNAERDTVLSNASCTTNCLAPVAKVINDEFGLDEGLMTTVHAVTATQPTQDGPSKKDWRGGRNAYVNIIPASTGAAKAVTLCVPELTNKLTGMAFRVPTADVSAVDLTFRTEKSTSLKDINAAMKAASEGSMKGVLAYTEEEVVSCDFIGDPHSSIYDAGASIELNDRFFKIISWYDNESGYSNRLLDMLRFMASKDGVK